MNKLIKEYIKEIRIYKSKSIYNLIKIGETLNKAKHELNRGDWLYFLDDPQINFSIRTAQRFIQLYKIYGHLIETDIDLLNQIGYTKLLQDKSLNSIKKLYPKSKIDGTILKKFIDGELGYISKTPTNDARCISKNYIAGLFDGEGSIGIYHIGGKQFRFNLTISNTYKEVLFLIQKKNNKGKIYKTDTETKTIYNYKLSNPLEIKSLLNQLNLFIKDKEKRLMIKAIDLYVDDYQLNFKEILKYAISLNYLKDNSTEARNTELIEIAFSHTHL